MLVPLAFPVSISKHCCEKNTHSKSSSHVATQSSLTTPLAVESGSATPTTTSFSFNLSLTPRQSHFGLFEQPEHEGSTLPPSSPPPYLQSPVSETGSDIGDVVQTFEKDDDSFPTDACTGQLIQWDAGSIWDTYAYPHHDDNEIGWMPIGYEGGNYIRLQSKSCLVFLHSDIELNRRTCDNCFDLLNSPQLVDFMDRSKKHTVPNAPWKYLNARQLKNMVIESRRKASIMKLEVI